MKTYGFSSDKNLNYYKGKMVGIYSIICVCCNFSVKDFNVKNKWVNVFKDL